MSFFLSKQSLTESWSFLEDMHGENEVVLKNVRSTFTLGLLRHLHLEASELSRTFLTQFLSSDDIYSPRGVRLKSNKG